MARSRVIRICVLACLWYCGVSMSSVSSTEYKWEVKNMRGAPDCFEKDVMGINGKFPGPTINAQAGDIVVVHLTNKLDKEGVVIHWHGITQRGTPWADGTASISQCPIMPGETYTYEFKVEKAGTFFYHGHYGMQRSAGLYGMLIVDEKEKDEQPFQYDGEYSLLLSDWWHEDVHEQEKGLTAKPMKWIGEPQSLLINGKGQYGCTLAPDSNSYVSNKPKCYLNGQYDSPLQSTQQPTPTLASSDGSNIPSGGGISCEPIILDVESGKTYRLRVASTTSLASLNLAISGHTVDVVEADGNYLEPLKGVNEIDIYSGESYSILIKADQDPSINYWISVGVIGREPGTPPGLAILRYQSKDRELEYPKSPPSKTSQWDDFTQSKSFSKNLFSYSKYEKNNPVPSSKGKKIRQIFLLNVQDTINGYTRWTINDYSLVLPSTPYLASLRYDLRDIFDQGSPPDTFLHRHAINKPFPSSNTEIVNGVYKLDYDKPIDVILQNANMENGTSEIHPWHLHGHDFWVLGYGEGKFSMNEHENTLNIKNPPLRNTVVLFPGGWTVLRFKADNPGVWAFHCHIEPHFHMGMGVIFTEGVDQLPTESITTESLACGLDWKPKSRSTSIQSPILKWNRFYNSLGS